MNSWFVGGLGLATLAVAVLHLVGGGRAVARPMLAANFDPVARETMYVCWHIVTLHLFAGGFALLGAAYVGATDGARVVVQVVSTLDLAYAALFVGVALRARVPRGLVQLGQWMLFLPLGVLGWYASVG